MKPIKVTALQNFRLEVLFEDGIYGVIDLSSFVDKGIFTTLRDKNLFKKAYTTRSSIAWSDELEIDATNIYLELSHKETNDLKYTSLPYATH